MSELIYKFKTAKTPVGLLKLIASDKWLSAILWQHDDPKLVRLEPQVLDESNSILKETERQLSEFFAGERTVFELPLDFKGTVFQKAVWAELLKVPFGQLKTYSDIAKAIGNPKAVRAVGAANGKNPISIICPCHRIVGADGSLTGFAGGLEIKATLLQLEQQKSHNLK
ncbi:MAG: methylated-DNA--[protein]-cysteine S-methyltransferase [Legionella sp.]